MCIYPCIFQLSPGAVSDMWCGALATDDDTVACIEIFTDVSSLIPKAWPRVAASGGWGVLVSAICDNQRVAVIGIFLGAVTVDSGHPFFLWREQCSDWCVRNSSNLGGLGLVSRCHLGGQECHNQTRQLCMPLEFWTGVTAAFHTCNWCELRGTVWRLQETSGNFQHTKAHQGQWQNALADSLAKMGSYSFPSESTLPLSMAR